MQGNILVVDDDEQFLTDTKALLTEAGFKNVHGADSASHAEQFISRQSWSWCPSLIITDIVMPGMGGYQFIRRVSEIYPDKEIPIIVISVLSSQEDISEVQAAGANAFIPKNIYKEHLLDTIQRLKDKKPGMIVIQEEKKPIEY